MFTSWRTGVSPNGFYTLVFRGTKPDTYYDHASRGLLLPNADGTRVYAGDGVFDNKTNATSPTRRRDSSEGMLLPSVTGNYCLRVPPFEFGFSRGRRKDASGGATTVIIAIADSAEQEVFHPFSIAIENARKRNGDRTLILFHNLGVCLLPRRTAHGVWPAKTARVEMGNLGFRLRAFLFWTGPILRDSCQ